LELVINPTARWAELEARYGREAYRHLTYQSALELFEALWAEARALGAVTGEGADWERDLAADRAVARAVNGLPPAA
jgi:hypothetical protein